MYLTTYQDLLQEWATRKTLLGEVLYVWEGVALEAWNYVVSLGVEQVSRSSISGCSQ